MREVYRVRLPAVVTVKDGLNIPRYPSVPGRIKARKKPIDEVAADPRRRPPHPAEGTHPHRFGSRKAPKLSVRGMKPPTLSST